MAGWLGLGNMGTALACSGSLTLIELSGDAWPIIDALQCSFELAMFMIALQIS